MEQLPKEMLAFILSKLDGISLVKAQRVCKLWYDIIHSFERHFYIWLLTCLKEIPLNNIVELTEIWDLLLLREVNLLSECKRLPWTYWRDIYAEYNRCELIRTREHYLTELCYYQQSGQVTSLALRDPKLYISDYQLLSGHEDGSVLCWNNIDDCPECSLLHKHHRVITDICVTTSGKTVEDLMSGENDSIVITSSQDTKVIINNMTTGQSTSVSHYSKQVNTVSCFGLLFLAGGNGNILLGQPVWEITLEKNYRDLHIEKAYKLYGHESSVITSVAVWQNRIRITQVLAGDDIGYLYSWKLNTDNENKSHDHQLVMANLGSTIKQILFRGELIICLTADGIIHVSTNSKDFKTYNVYSSLQKIPECIAVRGPLFVIGTKAVKFWLIDKATWPN
ncbi:hypothetical protein KUTeg_024691 [Tegillarca granosa]|uniref:F-box domain-containing protein n=1 Tax=Tegillarca granosa TaxID=220873 RepID=A0ABQ9DZ34_TEGGR|nr:hypothetical protein KUTeg_024691 [Tegillarca granosa]